MVPLAWWFVGPCSSACPHDVPRPLSRAVSQQDAPCSVTSCQVSSLPSSWPLSERFRGEFRTSQPTPKIVVWEATLLGSPEKPHQCHHRPHPEEQPALPGWELSSQDSDPSCYRGSEMQNPADRAGSDTRDGRFTHGGKKAVTPELGLMLFQPRGDAITGWD